MVITSKPSFFIKHPATVIRILIDYIVIRFGFQKCGIEIFKTFQVHTLDRYLSGPFSYLSNERVTLDFRSTFSLPYIRKTVRLCWLQKYHQREQSSFCLFEASISVHRMLLTSYIKLKLLGRTNGNVALPFLENFLSVRGAQNTYVHWQYISNILRCSFMFNTLLIYGHFISLSPQGAPLRTLLVPRKRLISTSSRWNRNEVHVDA